MGGWGGEGQAKIIFLRAGPELEGRSMPYLS